MPSDRPEQPLIAALQWALKALSMLVTEDDGSGCFVRATGRTELCGFGAKWDEAKAALKSASLVRPEQPLIALIAKWRKQGQSACRMYRDFHDTGSCDECGYGEWTHDCHTRADELEAALLVGRQTPPDQDVAGTIQALKNSGIDTECGACMEVAFTGVTTNQHTCEAPASPVLPQQEK